MSQTATKTTKQLVEECLSISKRVLMEMGETLGDGKPSEDRLEILLASIIRAVNCSEAISSLYSKKPHFEEMYVLVRALVELVINALYLQICPQAELDSYRAYDSIMLAKAMRFGREFDPVAMESMSEELLAEFETHVGLVKLAGSETISGSSWTKVDLYRRGNAFDSQFGTKLMQFLSRILYQAGHSYTHSNFSSLYHTIEAFRAGQLDLPALTKEADFALFETAQTLHTFTLAISMLKGCPTDPRLSYVNDLLKSFQAE